MPQERSREAAVRGATRVMQAASETRRVSAMRQVTATGLVQGNWSLLAEPLVGVPPLQPPARRPPRSSRFGSRRTRRRLQSSR
ncbi:MAG TPA: hypothetical protein VMZ90_15000 [Vicinamibacterales bacterium]|nr:hypothetical protein [Vicinamibacterales bacterium]